MLPVSMLSEFIFLRSVNANVVTKVVSYYKHEWEFGRTRKAVQVFPLLFRVFQWSSVSITR